MFLSRNKNPCKGQFLYLKMRFKGTIQVCFSDDILMNSLTRCDCAENKLSHQSLYRKDLLVCNLALCMCISCLFFILFYFILFYLIYLFIYFLFIIYLFFRFLVLFSLNNI